jgi:protein-tyrosine phosphatase
MQITAGSVMGRFGRRPRYWAERMLDEGLCHLLATDAHNTEQRAPRMADARDLVAQRLGDDDEAINLVLRRPQGILDDLSPAELPPVPSATAWQERSGAAEAPTLWRSLFKRARRMAGS